MTTPRTADGHPETVRGPLVLVVEDDIASRVLLERLLEREGYRTQAAGDGESALLATRESSPDLILLDIGCPASTALR